MQLKYDFGDTDRKSRINELTKYVCFQINGLWKQSIVKFLLGAAQVMSVDTGMSVASLVMTGEEINLGRFAAERELMKIAAMKGPMIPKKGHSKLRGEWASNNAATKSWRFGKKLGQEAYKIDLCSKANMNLHFGFNIVVFQHYFHDVTWDSLRAGLDAFIKHFDSKYNDYIDGDKIASILLKSEVV